MPKFTSPLDELRVAAPCKADWGKMVGDERVRFCGSCDQHVYNLSGMTKREAEALVTNSEGRLCVRYYRRADGSILTRNCPVGLSAVRRRVARVAGSVLSAALGFFAGLGLNFGVDRALSPSVMEASAVPAPPLRQGTWFPEGEVMGGLQAREYIIESDAEKPPRARQARRRR